VTESVGSGCSVVVTRQLCGRVCLYRMCIYQMVWHFTELRSFDSKEIGLEVNADKTKYMVMSRDQNVGRSRSIKTDNSSFERVEEFKYLGTTLTNKNPIQEEIKRRFKSGNACCHSVQNLLSSSLLSKNLKVKIYRTTIIILPVVLVWV